MISLNLLPDVKKEYLKSQRQKRMFVAVSFLVTVSAIGVVVLMALYVFGVQKLQIVSAQGDIDNNVAILAETPDLAKIVTIQNQLNTLPDLHDSKTAVGRLFNFLKVLTPDDVNLSSVRVDFVSSGVEISGTGEDFKAVNTFVDTLKNATYIYAENEGATISFTNVVLDTINQSDDSTVSFKSSFVYDPLIFDNTISGLVLSVPNITSTRSQTEKPKSLFDSPLEEDAN